MKLTSPLKFIAPALLAVAGATSAHAATTSQNLVVNVTMIIESNISVVWCDSAGLNDVITAQTWALGICTRSEVVVSSSTDVSKSRTAQPLRYIQNLTTDTEVDVSAMCTDSANWTVGQDPTVIPANSNTFAMDVMSESDVSGAPQALAYSRFANASGGPLAPTVMMDVVDNLGISGAADVSQELLLQMTLPTRVTSGANVVQTVTVTFTAAADNGD